MNARLATHAAGENSTNRVPPTVQTISTSAQSDGLTLHWRQGYSGSLCWRTAVGTGLIVVGP